MRMTYTPESPQKYTGTYPIIARSSWEVSFMQYCDRHPDVLDWASEPVQIPYRDPVTGSQKIYIPDFLVSFLSKSGERRTKLIEIKPMHEAMESFARNSKDVVIRARNEAKWGAATQWAGRRGIDFLVLTEAELYNNHANRTGRKHSIKGVGKEQVKDLKPKGISKIRKIPTTKSQLAESKFRKGNITTKTRKIPKAKKS
jgi:hypothetical protein